MRQAMDGSFVVDLERAAVWKCVCQTQDDDFNITEFTFGSCGASGNV